MKASVVFNFTNKIDIYTYYYDVVEIEAPIYPAFYRRKAAGLYLPIWFVLIGIPVCIGAFVYFRKK